MKKLEALAILMKGADLRKVCCVMDDSCGGVRCRECPFNNEENRFRTITELKEAK